MTLALVTDYTAPELLAVYEGQDYADLFEQINGRQPRWVPKGTKLITDPDGSQRRVRLWTRNYHAE